MLEQELLFAQVVLFCIMCVLRCLLLSPGIMETNQHFSVEDLAQILLTKSVISSQICVEQPCYVQRNAAFVVDLHKLKDPLDIKADENGTWIRKGSPVAYVSIHKDKGVTSIFRRPKIGKYSHHFKISRTYYRHSCSPDFFRIIAMAYGKYAHSRSVV